MACKVCSSLILWNLCGKKNVLNMATATAPYEDILVGKTSDHFFNIVSLTR